MRPAQNRIQHGPVQEQEVIDKFVTAAPGLPIARCGGGVMAECVNFTITPDRLEARQKLGNRMPRVDLSGARQIALMDGTDMSVGTKWLFMAGSDSKICEPDYGNGRLKETNGSGCLPGTTYDRLSIRNAYGASRLIIRESGSTAYSRSGILSGRNSLSIRKLGLPCPAPPAMPALVNFTIAPYQPTYSRYIGVEYVCKQGDVVVRSSGIRRSRNALTPYKSGGGEILFAISTVQGELPEIKDTLQSEGITHIRVWVSDFIGTRNTISKKMTNGSAANEFETNPDELWLMFEISAASIANLNATNSITGYSITGGTKKWAFTMKYMQATNLLNSFLLLTFVESNYEPYDFDELPENCYDENNPLARINLERMEKAACFSGGRLWGAWGDLTVEQDKIVYSCPAGVAWHEQRDPLEVLHLGLGEIKTIETLDGDLYAFCAAGVAMLPDSDPGEPKRPNQPRIVSRVGGNAVDTFAVEGFGIFAVIDGTLHFLDKSTRTLSTSCQGLDLNMLLGDLAKSMKRFAFHEGEAYFLAGDRLFKINMAQRCGISEIVLRDHKGVFKPVDISSCSSELSILCEQGGILSVWGYSWSSIMEDRMDCEAVFAKSAPHGWVEHWDTSVYAKLPSRDTVIGTEDICDGLLYPDSVCMNEDSKEVVKTYQNWGGTYQTVEREYFHADSPWEYRIAAGKDGAKRPIGKTIGIKVFIENAHFNSPAELLQAKLTTARQDEIFRKDFNPNKYEGEPFLATELGVALIRE